jgi:hypothetical protein
VIGSPSSWGTSGRRTACNDGESGSIKVKHSGLSVGALIGSLSLVLPTAGAVAQEEAPAMSDDRITVVFSSSRGELFRAERVNNPYPADQYTAQLAGDVAFINAQGLHGRIYRAWVSDILFDPKTGRSDPSLIGIFDPKTGNYDFDSLTTYLDQASRVSMLSW